MSVDTRNAPLLHMTRAAAGATESTVFSAIGHTPLIRLATIPRELFVGISSGAAMAAALTVARQLEIGVIVTVFPDGGGKYLDEEFWRDRRPVGTAEGRTYGGRR